jgi:hypothetical protein
MSMSRESAKEVYLGDGLYAQMTPAQMIILRAPRSDGSSHWVGLEPEVFVELLRFARDNGWGGLIEGKR